MNKKKNLFLNAGLPSVLLVFVLLCLITFSVLSLVSADADDRLSRQTAKRTQEYYAAEGAANRRLKEIDGILAKIYNRNMTREQYFEKLLEAVAAMEGVTAREASGEISILFQENIDEAQALSAELAVVYPQEKNRRYGIVRWQSVQRTGWDPETRLQVLQ